MWRRFVGWMGREWHQSWLMVSFCVGVIAGTILALCFRVNYFASPVWLGVVVGLFLVAYLKPKTALIIMVLVAGMVLAFFRASVELKGEDYVRRLNGETVLVAGIVKGDPETDEKGTKFRLVDLKFGEEEVGASGGLYVSVGENEELARGDEVVLEGKMSEGFGVYAGYMYKPKIVKWERPEPGDLAVKMRNWFAERIRGVMPETEANLGLSYLLGMRTGLSDELNEKLRTVGLVHIVVASGAHLSILVEVARRMFGKLSRFAGVLFSILFVVFFMSMVGWTPSIMRAGMMTILTLVAWYSGRRIESWRLIITVMSVTLIINPMFVVDLGWLLSFASYAGIMIMGPKLTEYFYGGQKPGFVASMILTTLSATLMTLPIVLYYYGQVSLISVIANLLILPTLPWAMGLVFMTGIFAGLPGMETVVAWCATKMLEFHIAVVEWFGEMRQFLMEIRPYQWWVFLLYLVIIGALVMGWIWKKRRKVVKLREVE
ncbi:MAG: ComEC/Rec2 family competence protein [Candidatus Saccharibacteria bacterium]|nr:ComEC/Rec2 family competence protein [Candidatus Saccharibacteria bacterium]